jgi:Zn finger protein HypA/HybF involved in hydrogenase expression
MEEITPKMFRCRRCRHSEPDTVPHRTRCPKCGAAIERPEREYVVASPRRRPVIQPY